MYKERVHLEEVVEKAWEERHLLSSGRMGDVREAVQEILSQLDRGLLRVADKIEEKWVTHGWIKKAILLSFRLNESFLMDYKMVPAYDKVPLKFEEWGEEQFKKAGFRVVPGAIVRHSAYIAPE